MPMCWVMLSCLTHLDQGLPWTHLLPAQSSCPEEFSSASFYLCIHVDQHISANKNSRFKYTPLHCISISEIRCKNIFGHIREYVMDISFHSDLQPLPSDWPVCKRRNPNHNVNRSTFSKNLNLRLWRLGYKWELKFQYERFLVGFLTW